MDDDARSMHRHANDILARPPRLPFPLWSPSPPNERTMRIRLSTLAALLRDGICRTLAIPGLSLFRCRLFSLSLPPLLV